MMALHLKLDDSREIRTMKTLHKESKNSLF